MQANITQQFSFLFIQINKCEKNGREGLTLLSWCRCAGCLLALGHGPSFWPNHARGPNADCLTGLLDKQLRCRPPSPQNWAGCSCPEAGLWAAVCWPLAVFLFLYFLFLFFTKIYFRYGNLQKYTPAAPLPGGRDLAARLPGGRG